MATTELSRSVAGRAAFITGAASGMGRAAAHVFGAEGVRLALADIQSNAADQVAKDVRDAGGQAQAWTLDVGDGEAIADIVPKAAEALGGLDSGATTPGGVQLARLD